MFRGACMRLVDGAAYSSAKFRGIELCCIYSSCCHTVLTRIVRRVSERTNFGRDGFDLGYRKCNCHCIGPISFTESHSNQLPIRRLTSPCLRLDRSTVIPAFYRILTHFVGACECSKRCVCYDISGPTMCEPLTFELCSMWQHWNGSSASIALIFKWRRFELSTGWEFYRIFSFRAFFFKYFLLRILIILDNVRQFAFEIS